MATRTYSEKTAGRKGYAILRRHALCDGCGKEHPDHYQGRGTAPLPATWTSSLRETKSSVQLMYWCEDCSRAGTIATKERPKE